MGRLQADSAHGSADPQRPPTRDFHELPGGPVERLFASAGLPPPRLAVQCESQSTLLALLARTDMLGILQRSTLAASGRDLQEIALSESMPSVAAGIYTRADAPLTRVAAAMVRAATSVARGQARRN